MRATAVVGIALLLGLAAEAVAASVAIAPDRMLVVDGKRTFVLGLYENPPDEHLRNAAEAGFNLVRSGADREALDRLATFGVFGWVNTGYAIDLSTSRESREERLGTLVTELGSHPSLLVWEVPDEALWNCWYQALRWQVNDEHKTQLSRIESLTDEGLKAELSTRREQADQAHKRGDFEEWERLCDSIWQALGEDVPGPERRLTNSPGRARTMAAGMVEGYGVLRRLDPEHPVWMNHAPRNSLAQLAEFNRAADIVGCDIYPAPPNRGSHSDLADRSLSAVGAFTTRMQAAAPGKPVFMVLQGFGWGDLSKDPDDAALEKNRRPTFEETRFMAFDAVVRGARGILYWGTSYIEKDSDLWNDLLTVVRELSELDPVLSAPDADVDLSVAVEETWGSFEEGVVPLAKDVDGELWLLVANEWHDPLGYTLHGLDAVEGTRYVVGSDGREAVVSGGALRLTIGGKDVQVLRPSP